MRDFFADLHIHVGFSESGRWVKIPTSRRLTLRNILQEAAVRKGMDIIGVVDALSPLVRDDLARLAAEGEITPDTQGGYRYDDRLTLLLGAEIETSEPQGGLSHTLVFLPELEQLERFAALMAKNIRNIALSSQNAHMPLDTLVEKARGFDAVIIPAHVFTPHKSLYGSCARRMADILGEKSLSALAAVELGLSADTFMADRISELAGFTFLSNSDAHSLDKIAREYNVLRLDYPSFAEFRQALARQNGQGGYRQLRP